MVSWVGVPWGNCFINSKAAGKNLRNVKKSQLEKKMETCVLDNQIFFRAQSDMYSM